MNIFWENFDILNILVQNIDSGYTFEPPHQSGSNEYPQSMFWKLRKNCIPLQTPVLLYTIHGYVFLSDDIRKTCPCSVYPLKPHVYIAKLGYAGVYLFFYVLSKNIKNIKIFLVKFSIFTAEKNLCILHGQVFVMKLLCAS